MFPKAMFNQNKIMSQDQRNRSNSRQRQHYDADSNGPYFKIIRDYRNSHSPSIASNPKRKSQREVKGSSELYSQSFESVKVKTSSKNKRNRHRFSLHSRKKRQISTRFRQENEVQLKKKMQVWSELWIIELNYFQRNSEVDLLHQINPSSSKAQKLGEKINQPHREQLLCNSQPIFLPQPQGIEIEERRPEQEEIRNTEEFKRQQDFFIYHNPYFDHENSLFNEENNSFFFDRVDD